MPWRLFRRIVASLLILLMMILGAGYLVLKRRAQPRPEIGPLLSPELREGHAAMLRKQGLEVPAGGVLLNRPFEAPWSSRSMVVPDRWLSRGLSVLLTRDLEVPADAVLRDLDVLEPVMSRAYGGWVSAQAMGWDWERWFEDWRAMLRARAGQTLTLDEAFAPMDILSRVRVDNHTQIPLQRMDLSSLSQSAQLLGTPEGPCDSLRSEDGTEHPRSTTDAGQQPRSALAWNATRTGLQAVHYVSAPSFLGRLKELRCGGRWIALRAASEPIPRSVWRIFAGELLGSGAPAGVRRLSPSAIYMRLPSMVSSNYRDLDRSAWPSPTGQERLLIVDVRGNGGGSAALGWTLLKDWVDQERVPPFEAMGTTLSESCLYPALKWNFTTFMGGARSLTDEDRAWMQPMLDALFAPADPDCPRSDRVHPPSRTWRDRRPVRTPERMQILVVTDARCGSDCEYLLMQLGALPETVIAGVNSGGVTQFIQPGYGVLPHSRLPFRMALGESDLYGDRRSVDGHGLDVDVLLTREEDWSEAALLALAEVLLQELPEAVPQHVQPEGADRLLNGEVAGENDHGLE